MMMLDNVNIFHMYCYDLSLVCQIIILTSIGYSMWDYYSTKLLGDMQVYLINIFEMSNFILTDLLKMLFNTM